MGGTCAACGKEWTQQPKKTFLGFRHIDCVACFQRATLPLSQTYRVVYWIIAVWVAFWMVVSIGRVVLSASRGGHVDVDLGIFWPGAVFGTLSGVALLRDKRLREPPTGSVTKEARNASANRFSWWRGLAHWLLLFPLVLLVTFVASNAGWTRDPNNLAENLGQVAGQLLVPVLGVSYLGQTGRRRWAWIVSTAFALVLFVGTVFVLSHPGQIHVK